MEICTVNNNMTLPLQGPGHVRGSAYIVCTEVRTYVGRADFTVPYIPPDQQQYSAHSYALTAPEKTSPSEWMPSVWM